MVLTELLKEFPTSKSLVTRRYPVNLPALQEKLVKDLDREFDAILHLGQSPGASSVKLEAIAVNAAGLIDDRGDELDEIVPSGPVAYRSNMPLKRWAKLLRSQNIPTVISYHAGTFLCNATMYLSHHQLNLQQSEQDSVRGAKCLVGFVHLPLATEQVAQQGRALASLPLSTLVRAVQLLLDDLYNLNHEQAEQLV
jgi:pyroglutamyl-peptidase